MGLWALVGCLGTLTTPDGADVVRGALFLDVDTDAYDGEVLLGLVFNSSFPCAPEDAEDDRGTPLSDEAAMSEAYWRAQLASAFTREGAVVVGFVLFRAPGVHWAGRYDLHEDTLDDPARRAEEGMGRAAAGFWYRVSEAEVDDRAEVVLTNDPLAYEMDERVASPARVDVTGRDDDVLYGTFDYAPAAFSGSFHARECDNGDLRNLLYAELIERGFL